MPQPQLSDNEADGPGYVLDYQESYGPFIHRVSTQLRASRLAKLLHTTFSGQDRQGHGPLNGDSYRYFAGEAELNRIRATYGADIPVIQFNGIIPSLQKTKEKIREANNGNELRGPELQDAIFQRLRNFFAEILPPQTIEQRQQAQAALAAPPVVLNEADM